MPVRRIKKSRRSLTGIVPSRSHPYAEFESSLERDFLRLVRMDPTVQSYESQPVSIPYHNSDGRKCTYVPDILVKYENRPIELVEIKYRAELRKNWALFLPKFRAARDFCLDRGWKFRIVTESGIRTGKLRFARFLMAYTSIIPADHEQQRLLSALDPSPQTIRAVLDSITPNAIEQSQLRSVLWAMVCQGKVAIDRNEVPTINSLIWRP